MRVGLVWGLVFALGLAAAACTSSVAEDNAAQGMRGFTSASELDVFARKMARLERRADRMAYEMAPMPAPPAMMSVEPEAADAAAAAPESITNTQEAGVDEGGIVKNAGDYLVILRRGRVFTVRTGDDSLAPVDAIDAFPPGKQDVGSTWYDELLLSGDQVIVIGYSYGDYGTEVNRFRLSPDGQLTYRDTHYLRSGDYYSSSNYASRLIGNELILYAPLGFAWDDWRERLPALHKRGATGRGKPLVRPENFYVPEPLRGARYQANMLHVVTRCDLSQADLKCKADAVAGTWAHAFYVSRDAVYVWTGTAYRDEYDEDSPSTPGQLYRLPLDGSRPGAVQVEGSPVDQFSFAEDAPGKLLRIVLREDGYGEGMWAGEYSEGDVALVSVPFARFGDGSRRLSQLAYRKLPKPEGYRFHNRFVGDWLLYAAADYRREAREGYAWAVPLAGGDPVRVALPHGVTRFDVLGRDAAAIGPDSDGVLGFSSISLGREAKREDTYLLAAASEGETRSQAFFFRPDPGSDGGLSGTLGLPVTRRLTRPGAEFLGSGSSIFFLRRNQRQLAPAGELVARTEGASPDGCKASCVDWYGNARPIFLGGRIFALMGYELVEGEMTDGRIVERRRANFAPGTARGG